MIDYYAELKIDNKLSINDINKELSKLENTWRRRELTNPDKAAKMIALILEARETFKTEESRRKYDRQLTGEDKKDEQRSRQNQARLQLEKSRSDAIRFFESEQYDLALLTVNNALSLMSTLGIEDDSTLSLAADIYRCNRDNQSALNLINRAILINSTNCMHYVVKAEIVGNLGNPDQKRNNLKIAISVATQYGSLQDKAEILGAYARSLYFDYPQDKMQAVQCAQEAIRLGETWGNAQAVIDAADKADQQMRRQQEDAERLERQRADEEARLAKQRADQQAAKKQEIEKRNRQIEAEKAKGKRWTIIFILSIVLFILYSISPAIIYFDRDFNALIVLAYYTFCSSLMCMSAAVKFEYTSAAVGSFFACLFCFGPASLVNGAGSHSVPFGKFIVVWAIIVIISGFCGKHIKNSQ